MREKRVFGLIVRIAGLLITLYGLYSVIPAALSTVATLWAGGEGYAAQLVLGIITCLVGIAMMRWAHRITDFSFKREFAPGRCQNCGYNLKETPDRCPECGTIPEKQI